MDCSLETYSLDYFLHYLDSQGYNVPKDTKITRIKVYKDKVYKDKGSQGYKCSKDTNSFTLLIRGEQCQKVVPIF